MCVHGIGGNEGNEHCLHGNEPVEKTLSADTDCMATGADSLCPDENIVARFYGASNSSPASLDCCAPQSEPVAHAAFFSQPALSLEAGVRASESDHGFLLPDKTVFRPPRSRPIYLSVSSLLI
jgi:hypothetical protein